MEKENFYEILKISPDASSEEIKKALNDQYRKWSYQMNAPSMDRRQQAEKMLKKLELMEEILLDEEKRKRYDQELKEIQGKKVTHIIEAKKLSRGQIPPSPKKETSSQQEKEEIKEEPPSQQEKGEVRKEPLSQHERGKVRKEPPFQQGKEGVKEKPSSQHERGTVKKVPFTVRRSKQTSWLIGSFVVLVIVVISFISWNPLTDEGMPAQNVIELGEPVDDMTPEELVEEMREYALQGKVYGVPFGIGATVEEVKAAWGLPILGQLEEERDSYYPEKYISLKICQQKVCRIRVEHRQDGTNYDSLTSSLPPRYESLTFDQVEKVLGKNYVVEHEQLYMYRLSGYELNFEVIDGRIVSFDVSQPLFPQTASSSLLPEQREFLSEVWQLGLQGKVYGIPFTLGTPRSEIEREWGEPSYTTENRYLQYDRKGFFTLDENQTVISISSEVDENFRNVYIDNENLHNITPEQVMEAWGTTRQEIVDSFIVLSYFNGTNTISMIFHNTGDPESKLSQISLRKGKDPQSEL